MSARAESAHAAKHAANVRTRASSQNAARKATDARDQVASARQLSLLWWVVVDFAVKLRLALRSATGSAAILL